MSCQVPARAALSVMPARWFVTYKSVKIPKLSFRSLRSRSRSCHLFDWTVSLFAQQSYLFLCKFHLAPSRISALRRDKAVKFVICELVSRSLCCACVVLGSAFPFRSVVIWCWCSAVNLSIPFFFLPHLFPVSGAECIFNWLQISGRAGKTEASAKEWNWILLL